MMLDEIRVRARQALAAWGLPQQEPKLLKYRENAVFRVRLATGEHAALRLHRPGYHSRSALLSELLWMDELRRNGLRVPAPIPGVDGVLLVTLAGQPVQFADLIGWVHGQQLGETGTQLRHPPGELDRLFQALGTTMADMHDISDRWTLPSGFERHAWNGEGLLGEMPVWGRFWDCEGVGAADRAFLTDLRQRLAVRIAALPSGLDYGLIHADLVRENVMIDSGGLALIDFDDCGHGWRLFDLATTLLRNRRDWQYERIKGALLEGYAARRPLGAEAMALLPLFLLLRSLTYIGWAGQRPELPDADARMVRYVAEARELAASL